MTPGELIRGTRRRHGLSQRRLATRAGTTQSAISRIEADRVSPSIATLRMLLRVMGEQLVLDAGPVEHGSDRTLLRRNLSLPPEERVRRGVEHSNFVLRNRGVAGPRRDAAPTR